MQTVKNNLYSESSAPTSQIEELYEHIRTFRRIPKGFRAIHMHFSVLDRLHKQPHHRRDIATAFNKLISPHEGKLFWTHKFDLFFVCKDCPHAKLEQAKLDAIRTVGDSPVMRKIIEDSKDDEICDWYDLASEYEKFYELVENLRRKFNSPEEDDEQEKPDLKSLIANLDQNETQDKTPSPIKEKKIPNKATVTDYDKIFPKEVEPAIGPMQLDKLERNIENMDMYNLIDDQNICVVVSGATPQIVFTKKYISLKEVNNSILPGYNIAGDKWLFQRLTETFDTKLMQALITYESFPDNVLSINMNISSISTKTFDRFVAKQKKLSEHPLIIELTLFDIMSDLTAYYEAQKKLDSLGCKICICKMDIQSLYVLNRDLINVDFLKIRWKKNYINSVSKEDKTRIAEAIQSQGKMRVVLSDCDSKQAIQFGNDLGIVMYQGFEIDKLQRFS